MNNSFFLFYYLGIKVHDNKGSTQNIHCINILFNEFDWTKLRSFKSVLYLSIPNLKVGRQKTFHNEHLD